MILFIQEILLCVVQIQVTLFLLEYKSSLEHIYTLIQLEVYICKPDALELITSYIQTVSLATYQIFYQNNKPCNLANLSIEIVTIDPMVHITISRNRSINDIWRIWW